MLHVHGTCIILRYIYTAYILVALFELHVNLATAVHDIKLKVYFSLSTAFFSFLMSLYLI